MPETMERGAKSKRRTNAKRTSPQPAAVSARPAVRIDPFTGAGECPGWGIWWSKHECWLGPTPCDEDPSATTGEPAIIFRSALDAARNVRAWCESQSVPLDDYIVRPFDYRDEVV